jgi:hypothetical protein
MIGSLRIHSTSTVQGAAIAAAVIAHSLKKELRDSLLLE